MEMLATLLKFTLSMCQFSSLDPSLVALECDAAVSATTRYLGSSFSEDYAGQGPLEGLDH